MTEEKKPYISRVFSFYFAPHWQSFFTILYLVFFLYFAVFHSGKLLIAFNFALYTIYGSASLLGLSYLFWGVAFLISLIIPFSVSAYAIFLFYEIWHDSWPERYKLLATALIIIGVPIIIVVMDEIIRIVGSQPELAEFMILNQLRI